MKNATLNFPFTAVAGHLSFKLALILSAVNPAIGGVLVSGPRGLAKSTLARGLADILPAASNISTNPPPFITLPLGASEEMLIGTLNLQHVLDKQKVTFQPGLLAKADQGILYVDEVNLLADNLVDQLLDVSASGTNIVERDGISHAHPTRFILLGTMNPDEGELRPQLMDRFGLFVTLKNDFSIAERVDIVKQREAFDQDPKAFYAHYTKDQENLTQNISQARQQLPHIQCPDNLRILIAERCHEAGVDGLRADIVWYRAAAAHCALAGRQEIDEQDIFAVEELVLGHRRNINEPPSPPKPPSSPYSRPDLNTNKSDSDSTSGDWGSMDPVQQSVDDASQLTLPQTRTSAPVQHIPQTRQQFFGLSKGSGSRGTQRATTKSTRIDWFNTFASHMGRWPLKHLRYKPSHTGQAVLNLILLDTSASVLRNQLFSKAKGVVLRIAEQAYLEREQFAMMGFGNQTVTTLLPQRRAPKALKQLLNTIPASGGTPLREMLQYALAYQEQQVLRSPGLKLRTYLISDGRTTQTFQDLNLLGDVSVIDMEDSLIKRGKAKHIAETLCAHYFSFPQLHSA